MQVRIEKQNWSRYITEFNDRNASRPTCLQVMGDYGAQLVENGLALCGISLDEKGTNGPQLQIMLSSFDPTEMHHLTHVVTNLVQVTPQTGADGRDESIEFIDTNGDANLLMFRHRARMAAHA